MGEQTRKGKAGEPVVHVDPLSHAKPTVRTGIRADLSFRMLAALFCAGMFVGTLGKSLVLGLSGVGGEQSSIAQMDSGMISTPMVRGFSKSLHAPAVQLRNKRACTWQLQISSSGRITSVSKV